MERAMAGTAGKAVFTLALVAHLGVLADGKMGASKARAERIKTAVTAAENAAKEWL